jgi:(p)ppGpp synthase/HD superfamily hydrolase
MSTELAPITKVDIATAANWPAPSWLPANLVGAYEFAREAHKNQRRKYTGEPYIVHPLDVLHRMLIGIKNVSANAVIEARLLQELLPVLKGCLLHDTVEDCDVSLTTIEREFGIETANIVFWVTDTLTSAQGNRGTRKRLEAMRIGHAPIGARCLKLCDIGSNTNSIVENDADFAVVYIHEKAFLLSNMDQPADFDGRAMEALFYNLMSVALANTAVI